MFPYVQASGNDLLDPQNTEFKNFNGGIPIQFRKPCCTYSCLIGLALRSIPSGRMAVGKIYSFLQ